MKRTTQWLTLAAAWFGLSAAAAPVPAPPPSSASPIAEALRLFALLPRTAPLTVRIAAMGKEGTIDLERLALVPIKQRATVTRMEYRQRTVTVNVKKADGKIEQVQRDVTEAVPVQMEVEYTVMAPGGKMETVPVPVKSCKFFMVTKEGKLEPLDATKVAAVLKKKTPILTGESTEADPRYLALIKPGTLYLAARPQMPIAPPPAPLPDRKPDN